MTQDPISSETHTPCLSANAQVGVMFSIMPMNSGKDYKAREVDVAQPLMTAPTGGNQGGDYVVQPIDMRNAARNSVAGESCGTGIGEPDDPSFTLTKQQNGLPAVAVQPLALRGREGGAMLEVGADDDPAFAIRAGASTQGVGSSPLIAVHGSDTPQVRHDTIVRRLTPTECERLQGYPDNYTEGQPDSARYRQLGNSVAVPCVEWIARRLIAVAVRDG